METMETMKTTTASVSEVKITKRQLLRHPVNDMGCSWFYLYHGRVYNPDRSAYKTFRLVSAFGIDDVRGYYSDGDDDREGRVRDWQVREYADVNVAWILDLATDFNDLAEFYAECRATVADYNRTLDF